MRNRTLILIAATLATVGACKQTQSTNGPAQTATPTTTPPNSNGAPAMVAEHGGSMGTSGGMITEVVTQPDGRLLAYVRGPQGPVADANVRVTVRNTDGTSRPVVVAWDAQSSAYVGYVWGVEPGQKTVDVMVPGPAADAPALTVSSQVTVAGVAHPPAARYGGSVEIIGQYAVEIVPSRSGDVAFFVMDLQGNPVPDANIDLPRVSIDTGATVAVGATAGAAAGGAVVVPPAPTVAANGAVAVAPANPGLGTAVVVPVRSGDHWVAHVEPTVIAQAPSVGFNLDLSVGGHVYTKAAVPSTAVIVALPPTITVPAQPTGVAVNGTVVVQPPAAGLGVAVPVGQPGVAVNGAVNGTVVVQPPSAGLGVAVPVAPQGAGSVAVPGVVANVNVGARVVPPAVPQPVGGVVVAPPTPGGTVVVNGGVAAPGVVVGRPGVGAVMPPSGQVGATGVVVGRPGFGTVMPPSGQVGATGVVVGRPGVGAVMPPSGQVGATGVVVGRPGVGAVMPPSGQVGATGVVVGRPGVGAVMPPSGAVVAPPGVAVGVRPGVVVAPPPSGTVHAGVVVGGPVPGAVVAPQPPPRPIIARQPPVPPMAPPGPPGVSVSGQVRVGGSVNVH